MKPKIDLYNSVTATIVDALEAGTRPWSRPWAKAAGAELQLRASGPAYRGINQLLLTLVGGVRGYTAPHWLTFKQAHELGGNVRKGEKATQIVFYKTLEVDAREGQQGDANGKARVPMLRGYHVFNAEQCDGLPAEPITPVRSWTPASAADVDTSDMPDWGEGERGDEFRADFMARKMLDISEERAASVQAIETIAWGAGAKPRAGYWWAMPWGKPGYIAQLWEVEPGRWITATSTSRVNGTGLSGFHHGDKGHPTRSAALLALMRRELRSAAHAQAMKDWGAENEREAAAFDKLAQWCIGMCPALLFGVDLAQEYQSLVAAAHEKETRRRAMLNRTHEIMKAARAALYQQGEYSGGSWHDRQIVKSDLNDGTEFLDRFVGEYHVAGAMPDGLELVVYGKQPRGVLPDQIDLDHPVLHRAIERLRAALDVPVRLATIAEHGQCKSDRERVTW